MHIISAPTPKNILGTIVRVALRRLCLWGLLGFLSRDEARRETVELEEAVKEHCYDGENHIGSELAVGPLGVVVRRYVHYRPACNRVQDVDQRRHFAHLDKGAQRDASHEHATAHYHDGAPQVVDAPCPVVEAACYDDNYA